MLDAVSPAANWHDGANVRTCAAKRRRKKKKKKKMKSSTSIVYVQFQSLHGDQRGSQLLFKFFLWGAQQPARMVFGSTLDCSEATKRPLWLLDTCRPLPPPLFPIVSLHLSPPTRKKTIPYLCCIGDPSWDIQEAKPWTR